MANIDGFLVIDHRGARVRISIEGNDIVLVMTTEKVEIKRLNATRTRLRVKGKRSASGKPIVPTSALLSDLAAEQKQFLDIGVQELGLPTRALNVFFSNSILYVGELVQCTEADLRKKRGMGSKTLKEIMEILAKKGLRLGMKLEEWKQPV